MIKIIIITIVLILLTQFILYYCNVDIFNMYIKSKEPEISKVTIPESEIDSSDVNELEESKEKLKTFLNELKQYNNNI